MDFMTFGAMEQATIVSITSEDTDFPKEKILELNTDFYWRAVTTANQTILMDLGSPQEVNGIYFFLHNQKAAGYPSVNISFSNDKTTFTSISYTMDYTISYNNQVAIYINNVPPGGVRYWKIYLYDGSPPFDVPLQVSAIWLGKYTVFKNEASYQEKDKTTLSYPVHSLDLPYNKTFKMGLNRSGIYSYNRKMHLVGEDQWNKLAEVFYDCRGTQKPLLLLDNKFNTIDLIKFTDDIIDENQTEEHIYRPTLKFNSIPQIAQGDLY